jgi:UDP-N-acetylglucosamine 1-carboxyvinyltransferase
LGKILINGGRKLNGSVIIHGSKNSTLPIMAASLLNKGITVIQNYPDITDVNVMQDILEYIGCIVNRDEGQMIIDTRNAVSRPIPMEISEKLRASSTLMGPMLARFGSVSIAPPGGCRIGDRPLDIHMSAFKRLGATWDLSENMINLRTRRLLGNDVYMRFPSVGATQNVIMAAVLAEGVTILKNAAREPEVIHLCEYLRSTGAIITGDGTDEIIITGVHQLENTSYTVPADRIVAGTYIAAVGSCKGSIVLNNCKVSDCRGFLDVYSGMGLKFSYEDDGIHVNMDERPVNLNRVETGPYPGFPTDMQSMTLSVAAISRGSLVLEEKIFEDRFQTVPWLIKMGADLIIVDRTAYITGVDHLTGCEVFGADLRGTAALVIAGLSAKGHTTINDADYIERGYMDLCENLRKLGADIEWEDD